MCMYNSYFSGAGWSSLVARRAHNPKVVGSNPAPATKVKMQNPNYGVFVYLEIENWARRPFFFI